MSITGKVTNRDGRMLNDRIQSGNVKVGESLSTACSLNALWADLMVEELIRHSVSLFCLSSGSRSAPLAMAVAKNSRATAVLHYDERGAAFMALGFARATGSPAAVICSSGTAAANLLPAVVEANEDNIPLILLTADRPPELRQCKANQTIDQPGMFRRFVRWQFDLPCPDAEIAPEFLLTTVDQAFFRATSSPTGPVHLNCMFREPLAPTDRKQDFSSYCASLKGWQSGSEPYTTYGQSSSIPGEEEIEEVARMLADASSGLLVTGRLSSRQEQESVMQLARQLGWPLLPDIGSGLRLGCGETVSASYYDLVIASADIQFFENGPITVLHLGGEPVSKSLQHFLAQAELHRYIRVVDHPDRSDPVSRVTHRYQSDIAQFSMQCTKYLNKSHSVVPPKICAASDIVGETLERELDSRTQLSEPGVTRLISRYIRDDGCLFIASSRPVRDMDSFAVASGASVPIGCNRGASGIDGTLASAVGFARGHKRPLTLLIGDLALLHDLNSLQLFKALDKSAVIVVINNNGGGIFSFLPIHEQNKHFERFFGTPHGLNFKNAAGMFGLDYHRPDSCQEFVEAYNLAQSIDKGTVIEVQTDREANLGLHREIARIIGERLNGE